MSRVTSRRRGVSLRCSRANHLPRPVRLRGLLARRDTTFSLPHTTSNGTSRGCDGCQGHGRCGVGMDHQCPGLLQGLSPPGGPHAAGVSGTVGACTTPPWEVRGSPPDVCPICVSLSQMVYRAWHKTRDLTPLRGHRRTPGKATLACAPWQRGFVSPLRAIILRLYLSSAMYGIRSPGLPLCIAPWP